MASQLSTNNSQLLQQHFDTLAETPDAPAKLREFVLELAERGTFGGTDAKKVPLHSVAEFVMGQAPAGTECNETGEGTIFVKAGEFGPLYAEVRCWTTRPLKFARKGDVLICVVGATVGKLNLAIDSAIGRSVAAIRPSEQLDTRFLYYSLMPFTLRLRRASRGSAQGVIGREELRGINIPFPPLAEQRRIVAKVEELLALCDALEEAQTAAREHRTRLVRSSFSHLTGQSTLNPRPSTKSDHLTTAQDESDFKKHSAFCLQHSELLFDSVPALRQAILSLAVQGHVAASEKTWPKKPESLGKFAPMQNGYAFQSEWFVPKGVRLLRNKNVNHGIMQWDDMECIVENRLKEFERFKLDAGDVVLSLDRPFISTGIKVARVRREDLPCLLLQRVGRFQPDAKRLHPDYLFLFLNSPHFAGQVDPGRSNGVPHISSKQVEAAEIFVPPLAEQQRIVAKVDELLRWCDALEARLTAARTTATHLLDASLHQILAA